ncbi:putative pectate lyase [Helianthus anomalus]
MRVQFKTLKSVVSMVEMSMRNNTERRKLGFFSCGTGKSIDDCWRCDPNWQKNRKRLADCGIGFGRNAIGGRDGRFYMVTNSGDEPFMVTHVPVMWIVCNMLYETSHLW